MKRSAQKSFARPPKATLSQRLRPAWGRLGLLLGSIALLTLAFAPFHLFFLSWVALVPWLLMVRGCRGQGSAFLYSWLGGFLFYVVNMWWLAGVTLPGALALLLYIALYWGFAALVVRGFRLLEFPPAARVGRWAILSVLVFAAAWTGLEWLRGYLLWGGLPWMYLAHAQTPLLPMCQIADTLGQWGVSFWVAMLNMLAALAVIQWRESGRGKLRQLIPAAATAAVLLSATGVYGLWRMHQPALVDGPRVMVVQSNVPQSTSGTKGASEEELVRWHVQVTRNALQQHTETDLVVWSETMMPALNPEYRRPLKGTADGDFLADTDAQISDLARQYRVNILTGSIFARWRPEGDRLVSTDRRNSVYLYNRDGSQSTDRYDKIHLVPFGEFIPFKESVPLLYSFFNLFNPYGYDYTLTPGSAQALTAFHFDGQGDGWRAVTPICFEDLDSDLVSRMFHPVNTAAGEGPERKGADILINVTNDGWFRATENVLHLQAAILRSIENRVPTARSVNTGVSGFVDSVGRIGQTIAPRTEGVAVAQVQLDRRISPYSRIGDLFGTACGIAAAAMVLWLPLRRWMPRTRPADKSQQQGD